MTPYWPTYGFGDDLFTAQLLRNFQEHGSGTLITPWRSILFSSGLTDVPKPFCDYKNNGFVQSNRDFKLQSLTQSVFALHGVEYKWHITFDDDEETCWWQHWGSNWHVKPDTSGLIHDSLEADASRLPTKWCCDTLAIESWNVYVNGDRYLHIITCIILSMECQWDTNGCCGQNFRCWKAFRSQHTRLEYFSLKLTHDWMIQPLPVLNALYTLIQLWVIIGTNCQLQSHILRHYLYQFWW